MIIVWRGLGLPIMMAGLFVTGTVSGLFGLPYLTAHIWPRLFGFGAGAVVIFLIASLRERDGGRRDLLYFMPLQVWAVIWFGFGICWAFLPGPSTMVEAASQKYGAKPAATIARANPVPGRVVPVNGLQLQGIFYSPNGQTTAIINNTTLFVGDRIKGLTVSAIEPKLVRLEGKYGGETVLELADLGQ